MHLTKWALLAGFGLKDECGQQQEDPQQKIHYRDAPVLGEIGAFVNHSNCQMEHSAGHKDRASNSHPELGGSSHCFFPFFGLLVTIRLASAGLILNMPSKSWSIVSGEALIGFPLRQTGSGIFGFLAIYAF
jgi:hypothetical protein